MSRIPTKTAGVYTQVTDYSKIGIPVSDRHSVDGSGFGTPYYFDLNELYKVLFYRLYTAAAHGLVSGDVGKPLSGADIMDDEDPNHYPTCVLVQVPSTGVLRVAPVGAEVTLAIALLTDGATWDLDVDGRFIYWDLSEGAYVSTPPVDSAPNMPAVMELLSIGVSTFTARVRCY